MNRRDFIGSVLGLVSGAVFRAVPVITFPEISNIVKEVPLAINYNDYRLFFLSNGIRVFTPEIELIENRIIKAKDLNITRFLVYEGAGWIYKGKIQDEQKFKAPIYMIKEDTFRFTYHLKT